MSYVHIECNGDDIQAVSRADFNADGSPDQYVSYVSVSIILDEDQRLHLGFHDLEALRRLAQDLIALAEHPPTKNGRWVRGDPHA